MPLTPDPPNQATAPEIFYVPPGAIRIASVDFRGQLDPDETIDSIEGIAVTVDGEEDEDLEVTGEAITDAAILINKRTVPAGQAVQFTVGDTAEGVEYLIAIQVITTAGQHPIGFVRVHG